MAATATIEHVVDVPVDVVGFGRPATEALARRIASAKHAHPLDRVTVIVPSNTAGLSVRRLLASGALGGTGLANVDLVTPFRLAELLGSVAVGDRRPLTSAVLAAAARDVLRAEPGMFDGVADHAATQAAVVSLYGELSRALPPTLAGIAASGHRGSEVVRIVRAVAARLHDHHDEDDLATAAAARVLGDRSVAASLGTVVWHLPERLSPAMRDLVAAVMRSAPSSAVVGLTGADDADAAVHEVCAEVGLHLPAGPRVAARPADRTISVSDPDEEVRATIRDVMALVGSGTDLDRIAVLYPTPDPYARTLLEQLAGAGIPHNGPGTTRLADTVAGRTLVAALALPGRGWRRGDVIALVTAAPVRHGATLVSATRWDALSRAAGVVGGLDDWRSKLAAHAEHLTAVHERTSADGSPARAAGVDDRTSLEALRSFVEQLAESVEGLDRCTSWADRSAAARGLLDRLLGAEHARTEWPGVEADAARRVDAALARLVVLDDVEPHPTAAAFELAVTAELDARTGRVGRFGHGVLVAPLAAGVGLDLDAVFVLGMAEGTCPSFRGEDALLPDEDRASAVAGELATRQQRLADQHRALLAALASAHRQSTMSFPRGDLRDRRSRLASRWLLDSAAQRLGRPLFSSDMEHLGPPVVETVASFAAGIGSAAVHGVAWERDVAALLHHVAEGGSVPDHPLAAGDLGRGLTCTRSREGAVFTAWDGNVGGHDVPSPATGTPVSPSRLETWASCPFRYFLGDVLRLSERDDPEDIVELEPAERGSLVHEVLERFIGDAIARPGGPPAPSSPWDADDHERIRAIAAEAFARREAAGLTGRPLLWRRTQLDVLAELDRFVEADDRHRAARGVTPLSVEMAFGTDGAPPVHLDLADGRSLTLRGRADRVDVGDDGRLVVLDYKTGKDRYAALADDPVQEGRTLQLGAYAEAATARHGGEVADTAYWMVSSAGGFAQRGYPWTGDRRTRFLDVVGVIVDGIESGTFPARPGAFDAFFGKHENCRHCDFDRICPRNRDDHADAKVDAPELSLLALLRLPSDDEVPS